MRRRPEGNGWASARPTVATRLPGLLRRRRRRPRRRRRRRRRRRWRWHGAGAARRRVSFRGGCLARRRAKGSPSEAGARHPAAERAVVESEAQTLPPTPPLGLASLHQVGSPGPGLVDTLPPTPSPRPSLTPTPLHNPTLPPNPLRPPLPPTPPFPPSPGSTGLTIPCTGGAGGRSSSLRWLTSCVTGRVSTRGSTPSSPMAPFQQTPSRPTTRTIRPPPPSRRRRHCCRRRHLRCCSVRRPTS